MQWSTSRRSSTTLSRSTRYVSTFHRRTTSKEQFTEAFNHYSRALQYTLTKVTKGEPYRFVVQCNHNNSSGFETWRRLNMTYDQGEKAQQLGTLSRIMS
eukprot:2130790-Amphidinium_carterae.1